MFVSFSLMFAYVSLGNKLNEFSLWNLSCLGRQLVSSISAFISTHKLSHPIFSLLRRSSEQAAGWAFGCLPGLTHHKHKVFEEEADTDLLSYTTYCMLGTISL